MLTLPNGKKIDFLCSSGALGFTGNGYWWEKPFFWMKWIRPEELTIITKTLTYAPRKGNYRWWKPWETFCLIKNGTVNALDLPNPGYKQWVENYYSQARCYKVIVSIAPESVDEAKEIAGALSMLQDLVAIEVNVSCPNFPSSLEDCNRFSRNLSVAIVETVVKHCSHPVIVKLGVPYMDLCRALDKKVAAFDLINSVPWNVVFPKKPSPLWSSAGGLFAGGVSGSLIKEYSREALRQVLPVCRTPIITGGGIDSLAEVRLRAVMGARAFTFGTLFLRHPSLPNKIAKDWRENRRL